MLSECRYECNIRRAKENAFLKCLREKYFKRIKSKESLVLEKQV